MSTHRSDLTKCYLAVLCSTGLLYAISCAPGALWQDSGLIQYRVWNNDVEGFLGLAISHPLYYIVAIAIKSIPIGAFGYKVNLVSAIAGALTVANVFLLVRLWLGKDFPAVIAAITLAVSHTFWRHASIAETYTLWAAFSTGELVLLLQYCRTRRVRYLHLVGLVNGLALAVHMLASIALACYAVLVIALVFRKHIRVKDALIFAGLWILGALPFEYLITKHMLQSGDVFGTLASAAFGARWRGDVLNANVTWRIVKENGLFFGLNFPTANILLVAVGFVALFKACPTAGFRNVMLGLIVLYLGFAFRYTPEDRYAFFIPFYCLASVLVGLGADLAGRLVKRKAFACAVLGFTVLPVAVYAAAPGLAERARVNIGTRGDVPYRNDYKYFLQPWKTGYRGADRFGDEALATAGEQGVIWADTTTIAPLLYAQAVHGKGASVKILPPLGGDPGAWPADEPPLAEVLAERPAFVVSRKRGYCPRFILDEYELERAGVLWRVVVPTEADQ